MKDGQISLLSESFKTKIEEIVDKLSQAERSFLTPSDIDYIVEEAQLADLQKDGEVEGVYLANSLQEGFVYHALNQGETDDAYRVQLIWDYFAGINPENLKRHGSLLKTVSCIKNKI